MQGETNSPHQESITWRGDDQEQFDTETVVESEGVQVGGAEDCSDTFAFKSSDPRTILNSCKHFFSA